MNFIAKVSAYGFILLFILLHLLKPEIDPTWQPFSYYLIGEYGWLMQTAFLVLGLSFFALSIGVFKGLGTWRAKVGAFLLVLAGIGNVLCAIYYPDPMHAEPTVHGQWHTIGLSLIGAALLGALFICLQFYRQSDVSLFRGRVLFATVLFWAIEISMIFGMLLYYDGPEGAMGGLGRLVILMSAIWVIITANALRNKKNL
jgi:hypothetical protein